MRVPRAWCAILAGLLALQGCSPSAGSDPALQLSGSGGAGGAIQATGGSTAGSAGGFVPFEGQGGSTPGCGQSQCQDDTVCGNAVVGKIEGCDDGNVADDDGCTAACQVSAGWLCPGPGIKCVSKACGDGVIVGKERCDDGNPAGADGCSDACTVEIGWACDGAPSACHRTTCGDANREGAEQCDDGNLVPYDGCSPTCGVEPVCRGGSCSATCGDGFVFQTEECDDGNTVPGDGCSATCAKELGFACEDVTLEPPSALDIPILYRDFLYAGTTTPGPGHPDFEALGGSATGLVQTALGADGKPVFASSTGSGSEKAITDATSFFFWYHEEDCRSSACTPNPYERLVYLDAAQKPTTLTLTRQASGAYQFSTDAFFPLNHLGWGDLQSFFGVNYSFTSELRYQFTYRGGEVLTFRGDDDVYVFINGVLAVDLGGLHGPETGTITLDAAAATRLGLTAGGMYEIALFQAERHTVGSNYTLTLTGFEHKITTCHSVCGDGVITSDEACDDGVNDTTYGSCTPDCHARGSYCGDGNVDPDHGEECDGTPDCSLGCRLDIAR